MHWLLLLCLQAALLIVLVALSFSWTGILLCGLGCGYLTWRIFLARPAGQPRPVAGLASPDATTKTPASDPDRP